VCEEIKSDKGIREIGTRGEDEKNVAGKVIVRNFVCGGRVDILIVF
jgi:hypothetical protein